MRLQGVIRKWVNESWGIVHSYTRVPNGAPEKYFVHKSQLVDETATLDSGVRISFEIGEPRRKGDLRPAVRIEIVPMHSTLAPADSSAGAAR